MSWAQHAVDAKQMRDARKEYPDAPSDRCALVAHAGQPHAEALYTHGHIGLREHRWLQAWLCANAPDKRTRQHISADLRPLMVRWPILERPGTDEPKGHMAELADGWMPEWVKVPT